MERTGAALVTRRQHQLDKVLQPGRRIHQGEARGLTILVEFADVDMHPNITKREVQELLNGDNYKNNGNYCSVREYFKLMSSGKLVYTNEVVGPVRLKGTRQSYEAKPLNRESIDAFINEIRSQIEWDRNSDAVTILYAGGAVYGGGGLLWPHTWDLEPDTPVPNSDSDRSKGISYSIQPLGRVSEELTIGQFCENAAHMLCRFPDLYDMHHNTRGIGEYCLMGSGSLIDGGRTPAPICGFLREMAGWADNTVLINSGGVFKARHGDYGTTYRFQTQNANEYFIVENRSRLGLDSHLPSSGLAVYHCDTSGTNNRPSGTNGSDPYMCLLLQADGKRDLEENRDEDEADLFGAVPGVAVAANTKPDSRMWDGQDSGLKISDISAPGEVVTFRVEPVGMASDVSIPENVFASARSLPIPDNSPEGVTSKISIDRAGRIEKINVAVEVIHTYSGDLRIELIPPSGRSVLLFDRTTGNRHDVRLTFTATTTPALNTLAGESITGDWVLRIADHASMDVGKLNSWQISVQLEK